MKPLTIGIDVDEVVAKLHEAWILDYNRRYDDRLTVADIDRWEINQIVKPECGTKIFELLVPAMYEVVEAYEGTAQAVRKIRAAGHRVAWITSSYSEELYVAKLMWLERHGFECDDIHGIGKWAKYQRKADVPGIDWLVDDHIGNLKDFPGYQVLVTRPHNRHLLWLGKRIKSLEDIVPMLTVTEKPVELLKPAGPIMVDVPEDVLYQQKGKAVEAVVGIVAPPHPTVFDGIKKASNPKDGLGSMKVPLHFVSGVVKVYDAIAHYLGNVKYGAWNYLVAGARASVYKSALDRHMDRWWHGEDKDPVDGTWHLANAKACINILIECQHRGNLIDDRPPSTDLGPLYAEAEEMMASIRERYKDKDPKHYSIAD